VPVQFPRSALSGQPKWIRSLADAGQTIQSINRGDSFMKTSDEAPGEQRPLSQDVLYALSYYLGGRRGLIALAVGAAIAGVALNWSWLVALGMAPLLLALAPCAVMCALGLCAMRMAGTSGASESDAPSATLPEATVRSRTPPRRPAIASPSRSERTSQPNGQRSANPNRGKAAHKSKRVNGVTVVMQPGNEAQPDQIAQVDAHTAQIATTPAADDDLERALLDPFDAAANDVSTATTKERN
jgi:hypothetical protein